MVVYVPNLDCHRQWRAIHEMNGVHLTAFPGNRDSQPILRSVEGQYRHTIPVFKSRVTLFDPRRDRRSYVVEWDIAIYLLQCFPERLLNKKLLFDAVFGSRDETKIAIRNPPRSRFYRFSVPAYHSVPLIAIAGIRQQADADVIPGTESGSGKILAQRPALAVQLVETPEFRRGLHRFQAIAHLIEHHEHVGLAEPDSLSDHVRIDYVVVDFNKNRSIQIVELARPPERHVRRIARPRRSLPVANTVFQASLAILENS